MKSDELRIYTTSYKEYTVVHFENYKHLDLYNTMDLVTLFQDGNSEGNLKWVLDMANMQYIDSSGLGVLSKQGRYLRERSAKLILINLQSSVQHLLTACGLNWLFDVLDSEEKLP